MLRIRSYLIRPWLNRVLDANMSLVTHATESRRVRRLGFSPDGDRRRILAPADFRAQGGPLLQIQIISVYAVEVVGDQPHLDPTEHSAYCWRPFDAALTMVHYRGLKDGLRSVREYVTGPEGAAPELCLRSPSTM